MSAAQGFGRCGAKRRTHSFGVIEIDQFAPFFFEIRHADFREGLERAAKLRARATRALRNAPFFTAIARQKDNDAVSFTKLVSAEHERISGIQRHLQSPYLRFYRVWRGLR